MGLLPDKFILLNIKESASLSRIKNNIIGINQSLYGPELEEMMSNCYKEYLLNIRGVREVFGKFIFEHNGEDKA